MFIKLNILKSFKAGILLNYSLKYLSKDYRYILNSHKIILGLVFTLLPLKIYGQPTIFEFYKNQNYQQLVDNYGSSYASLGYKELILLGEAYKNLKNFDRQIKILKLLEGKKPSYYKIHLAIAQASRAKAYKSIEAGDEYKNYEQALTDMIDFYRSAIKLNPKNIMAYEELMEVYKNQENVPEGLALTKSMLDVFGERPRIVLDLCEWTRKYGLVAQTQKACLKASELSPLKASPLVNLALAIKDSGEQEKYQIEIFKVYETFPNDEAVVDLIGEIYTENKDYVNAEKTLLKNKKTKLENSRINLASALFENEKFDQALDYFTSSCPLVNEQRKKFLRYFESRLRRLEIAGEDGLAFKFQRELNNCRSTPVVITQENKIRFSHFSQGIRLPSNAKNLDGQTLSEKRYNYDQAKIKANTYKPTTTPNSEAPK